LPLQINNTLTSKVRGRGFFLPLRIKNILTYNRFFFLPLRIKKTLTSKIKKGALPLRIKKTLPYKIKEKLIKSKKRQGLCPLE
jgi:hypothetical protein